MCNDDLKSTTEETNNYGYGWSQFNSNYTPPNGFISIYNAFQYKDADSLAGSAIQSRYNTYPGSGYVFELRGKLSFIQGNLSLLQQMKWIDRQTAAIFIEFTLFYRYAN